MGGAAAEKSTATNTTPEGSDSGYGSTGNTTDGSTTEHSQEFADGVALPSRNFFERKITKLRLFDKEIPQLTQHRFHDLHELFERPLYEYLIKAKVNPNPISIKLKVLGESEATAKPWIVVLCSTAASKKIRQFLNQPQIKAAYQPPDTADSFLPTFKVFVCNRPPRPMAGTEIYSDFNKGATMCGRIIKVGEAHQSRFATLGGVIKYVTFEPIVPMLEQKWGLERHFSASCTLEIYFKARCTPSEQAMLTANFQSRVVKPSGNIMLYGMSAGHILVQQPLGQDTFDELDYCDEEDEEDEGFYSGEEEYELDDPYEGDEEVQDSATTGEKAQNVLQSTQLGRLWPKVGCVSAASNDGSGTGNDLDWILIEFDRTEDCRPNLLVSFDREKEAAGDCQLKENRKCTEDGSSRSVFLLSGTGGVKRGTLSTSLSFLMMGAAKAFTKTYTLVLPRGSGECPLPNLLRKALMLLGLTSGDCGSWVVDPLTREVYGHVVASDTMGDSYVVPLNATLRDMEEKLGAAVSLPTEAYVHTWLVQHAKAAAEHVITPAKSKKKKVMFGDPGMDRSEVQRDFQKLTRHSSSLSSTLLAPSATKTSTSSVVYSRCMNCNAKIEGTSQDVSDNMLRHLRACSKHGRDAAPGTENSTSQNSKDTTLDERSVASSVKNSKDSQRRTKDTTSTQQATPVARPIRSLYSSFKEKSSSDSQRKDGAKVSTISDSKDKKPAGSASSTKPAATASPSTADRLLKNKKNTSESNSKRQSATPPINRGLPARSPALTGRMSKDLPPAPLASPVIQDRRRSGPIATPSSSYPPPPLHSPPPPLAHGHQTFHKSSSDPHRLPHSRKSGQVSYEGYTFIKCDSKQTGQKETWAVARMDPMPVSQEDLKAQIEKNRKKHISALDEYNDEKMKGNKRKQVDNLIRERTKVDGDYGYEYVLASIKRDSRRTKSKIPETLSMQVILKRQPIAGFFHEPSTGPPIDFHAKLPSQVMDLTSRDDPGKVEDYHVGSQGIGPGRPVISFAGHPQPTAFPVLPAQSQIFRHGVPHGNDRFPPIHAAPFPLNAPIFPAQGLRESPHPPSVPLVHQEVHNAGGRPEEVNDSKDKKKKKKEKDRKKKENPQIVSTRRKSLEKYDYASNSPSLSESSMELDSDNSWTKTDAKPDTVVSGESSEYRKEKRYHKEGKISIHQKDNIEQAPYAHETERLPYREHRMEEHRRSSLSPARRPGDVRVPSDWSQPREAHDLDPERHGWSLPYAYDTRYRDHRHYEMEPAISFPANRTSRHRRSSLSRDRPSHGRASSYHRDHSPAYDSRAMIPTYIRPGIYGHGAELALERERLEMEWLQERDDDEARARRIRDMERYESDERDASMGDRYIPRQRRDPGYYY